MSKIKKSRTRRKSSRRRSKRPRKRVAKTTRRKIKRVVMSLSDTKYIFHYHQYKLETPAAQEAITTDETSGQITNLGAVQFNNVVEDSATVNKSRFYAKLIPLFKHGDTEASSGFFSVEKGTQNNQRIGDEIHIKRIRFNCRIPILVDPSYRTRIIVWRSKQIPGNSAKKCWEDNFSLVAPPLANPATSGRYLTEIPAPSTSNIEIVKYTEIDPIKSGINFSKDLDDHYVYWKDYKFSIKRKEMKFQYNTGIADLSADINPNEPINNWYYYLTYAIIAFNNKTQPPYTAMERLGPQQNPDFQIQSTIVYKDI